MRNEVLEFARQDVLDQLFDGLYITDKNRTITYWNAAAEKITGFARGEVIGRRCADNILMHVNDKGDQLCLSGCPLLAVIESGEPQDAEVFLHHKDGHRVPVNVRVSPLKDDKGEIVGAVEIFSDNSSGIEAKARITELERLALWDELTQLPNRRYLQQQVKMRFSELERTGLSFGMAVIDIDHFKNFNDLYGHDVGDKVLKIVSQTMSNAKRFYDVVGRWGGEEFLLVAPNVNTAHLVEICDRFRALVEKSRLKHKNEYLSVTISLGAAVARKNDNLDSLFRQADKMLYQSKENGRNRVTMAADPK